jgi:hypothetical protein
MQDRWRLTPSGDILYNPNLWSNDDIEDILWLQEELSGDILLAVLLRAEWKGSISSTAESG